MKTYYRVNQIRSQRAVEREKLEHPTLERHVGDYDTIEEAEQVYNQTNTGIETEKELLKVTEGKMSDEVETIETTY